MDKGRLAVVALTWTWFYGFNTSPIWIYNTRKSRFNYSDNVIKISMSWLC